MQPEADPEASPSESSGGMRGRHPNSLANLKPPWRPGASGNPSGLTKDGHSPKGQALRSALISQLEQSGGMPALAKRWIALAKKGNSTALAAILERLDPVEKDSQAGKTILTGIKLELTAGGASLTMGHSEQPTPPPSPSEGASTPAE